MPAWTSRWTCRWTVDVDVDETAPFPPRGVMRNAATDGAVCPPSAGATWTVMRRPQSQAGWRMPSTKR